MANGSIKIDTVPLPEMPVSLEIPDNILREFKKDARVVIRHPWVIGIPIPYRLLKPEILRKYRDFEVMLVPKAGRR